jgi:hypothetical protein
MKSPKPEIPTYSMPLADLLDLLGTRRTSERPSRTKRDRRPPPVPLTPPDDQRESEPGGG